MTHPEKSASTADTVATTLLWIALVVVGGVGGFFSLFAVMATDRCSSGSDDPCNYLTINAAFAVAWGGLALAAVIALVGTIWATNRRTTKFVWPLIGLILVVLALGLGTLLLNAGVGMDFARADFPAGEGAQKYAGHGASL